MLLSGPAWPLATSSAALSLQVSPTSSLDQGADHDVSMPLLNGLDLGPASRIPISD